MKIDIRIIQLPGSATIHLIRHGMPATFCGEPAAGVAAAEDGQALRGPWCPGCAATERIVRRVLGESLDVAAGSDTTAPAVVAGVPVPRTLDGLPGWRPAGAVRMLKLVETLASGVLPGDTVTIPATNWAFAVALADLRQYGLIADYSYHRGRDVWIVRPTPPATAAAADRLD